MTEFGWSLELPWGWDIVKKVPDSNFVWLGKEMPYQWIGIGWREGSVMNSELAVGNTYGNGLKITIKRFNLVNTNSI